MSERINHTSVSKGTIENHYWSQQHGGTIYQIGATLDREGLSPDEHLAQVYAEHAKAYSRLLQWAAQGIPREV